MPIEPPASPAARRPRITVIVPVYNGMETIERALEGLRRQTVPRDEWELVVVDNNSTDGTWEWLQQTVSREPDGRMRAERELRRGPSAARNRGARLARAGEFLAFLDADCRPEPDWLAALLAAFDSAGSDTWAFGGRLTSAPPSTAAEEFTARQGILEVEDFYRPAPFKPPFVLTANFAVRRSAFEDSVGPFDESLQVGEDADFCWRLQMAGGRLGYAPEAVAEHRHRTSLRRFARQMFLYGRGSAHIFRLHRRFIGRRIWIDGHSWRRLARALVKILVFPVLRRGRPDRHDGLYETVRYGAFIAGRLTGAIRYRVPVL